MPVHSFEYDSPLDFTANVVPDGFTRRKTGMLLTVDETIPTATGTGIGPVTKTTIRSLFCKDTGKQGRGTPIGLDLKSKLTDVIVSPILLKKLNYDIVQPDKWTAINIPKLGTDKDTFWDTFFNFLEDITHDTDSMLIGDTLQFIFTFNTPTAELDKLTSYIHTIKTDYTIDIRYTLIADPQQP